MIIIKQIDQTDIDLSDYEQFIAKSREPQNLHFINALNMAIESITLSDKLAKYKTLLEYTLSELEADTKIAYSVAFLNASNINHTATSDLKREAVAKQDATYRQKLEELAKIKALLSYITNCYENVNKLHYVFKAIYMAETKIPTDIFGGQNA